MHRTLKICLICIAWAAIGTQVALSVNPWLWWVGLLVGALGGYLTVDWRTVVWAIPIAWKRTTAISSEQWRAARRVVTALAVWVGSLGLVAAPLTWLVAETIPINKQLNWWPHLALASTLFVLWVQIYGAVLVANQNCGSLPAWSLQAFAYDFNPIRLLWQVPRAIVRTIPIFFIGMAFFAIGIGKFTWHLYRLIHTEERWLCSVDIACGVAVGYWSISPLIGGLAGGAFWLANRLLIAGLLLRTLPARVRS